VSLVSDFFKGASGIPIPDLLAMYSAVRRASGAHFDADHRLCQHVACPHYIPNYCNSYPGVPRTDPARCKFPSTMSQLVEMVRLN